jgi:hypothetical protein
MLTLVQIMSAKNSAVIMHVERLPPAGRSAESTDLMSTDLIDLILMQFQASDQIMR